MALPKKIKFGTDGWRGVIAEDFTFENVRTVAQAVADYFKALKTRNKTMVVGYDTRYQSENFAREAARVLAGNGFTVLLSDEAVSTPTVSFSVVNKGAVGGIMVSASHNLPEYNGIKIKLSTGASITSAGAKKIESFIGKNKPVMKDNFSVVPLKEDYLEKLKSLVNLKAINKSRFKVVIDPMWGSSSGYLTSILSRSKMELLPIHHERDVLFGGNRPEPLEHNLLNTIAYVKKVKADICLVTDGDGDRVAVIDGKGVFHSAQDIIPLIMTHLITNKKWKGGVVKTNATTSAVEVVAKHHELKLHETPIGFKHIADLMVREDILIGGEESGGIGIKYYIPERDGVLMNLLMLEMMAHTGKTLVELFAALRKKYGTFCYSRIDLTYPPEKKEAIFKLLKEITPGEICGKKTAKITRFDGTKFIFEDLSWLLIRASGTEPVVRIYAEGSSMEMVNKFLQYGEELIKKV